MTKTGYRKILEQAADEARVAVAAEALRALHEDGEVEWGDLGPLAAFHWAFMDDLPDPEAAAEAA